MDMRTTEPSQERASLVVDEYLAVLKDISSLLAIGAPETLLPAPKDEIRLAIHTLAHASIANDLGDTRTVDTLRQACLALANFVTYEEANAAARLRAAFERGDRAFIASSAASQVTRRSQQIELDSRNLAREFDEVIRSDSTGTLMSELDKLLAEVNGKFAATLAR